MKGRAVRMNKLTLSGMALCGGLIAFEHCFHPLADTAALILYAVSVILLAAGLMESVKQRQQEKKVDKNACRTDR